MRMAAAVYGMIFDGPAAQSRYPTSQIKIQRRRFFNTLEGKVYTLLAACLRKGQDSAALREPSICAGLGQSGFGHLAPIS